MKNHRKIIEQSLKLIPQPLKLNSINQPALINLSESLLTIGSKDTKNNNQ